MPDHDPETGAFVKDEVKKQEIIDVLQRCEQEHGKVVNATYSNYISRSQILRHFESQAHAKMEAGVHNIGAVRSESMRELLNNYFEENQFIQDMTVGLMMGDASATKNTETRNSQIQMEVVNREFAEHVREMYGPLATDVKQYEKVNETEMSEDEFELTVYKIRTRRLECFNEFRDNWYTDEGKRYPIENINMNKTILKYWYASDGDMCTDNRWNTKHYARISCHNEMDRQEEINSLFSDLPFEPNWNDGGRFTFGRYGSIKFWDYLDNKVPGYKESKWPNQSYFEEERNQSN
jgi:hypothetical protein